MEKSAFYRIDKKGKKHWKCMGCANIPIQYASFYTAAYCFVPVR